MTHETFEYEELIEEIRDFHPSFSAERLPVGAILRVLSRKLNYETGRIVELNPDAVSTYESKEDFDWGPAEEAIFESVSAPFARTLLEVAPFSHISDDISVYTADGTRVKVDQVSLSTQYPGPYQDSITFPAVVPLNSALLLTDLRKVGFTQHGWQEYLPRIEYHYVPFYDLTKEEGDVVLAPGLRSPVILDTALELAKRAGLYDLAGSLEGQYDLASEQLTFNIANVAQNVSAVGSVGLS